MTVILDQFLHALRESGLMTAPEIDTLLDSLPPEQKPQNGEDLAKILVKCRKLTKFQAWEKGVGKVRGKRRGDKPRFRAPFPSLEDPQHEATGRLHRPAV
jgi:hypothetical protein